MKNKLICACVCAFMILSLAACGNNVVDNTEEHSHDSNTEEEYLNDAEVELKLALSANVGEAHYEAAEQFADQVKEKTEGAVRIEICDARQFGDDKELLAGMQSGEDTVDILITSVSNYTDIEPRMDITALPFLFRDYNAAWRFVEGEIQAEIEKDLILQNIHVLAHYSNGFSVVTTNEKSISVAQDMQNLSMIVASSEDEDALRIVGENVSSMVNENFGCLLITHYQRLLDYIKPDFVHIMINGKIVKTGGRELIEKIDREGYDWVKKELGIEIETDEKKRIVLGTCGAKTIANE